MSEEDEKVLVPQVQWAQRKNMIIIRVLVRPVEVKFPTVAIGSVSSPSLLLEP